MLYRTLGRTGLRVSAVALGAGPVSGLMTGSDADRQAAVVERATQSGINWIDTAAGYGQGQSEASLGRALRDLAAHSRMHVATKVRMTPEGCSNPAEEVRRSFDGSLQRLQTTRVTLLQLHNAITAERGSEAASITPDDVLRPGGVLDACEQLREQGLIGFIGLTGTGHPDALRTVIHSGRIDTVQVPFHMLNPSAGRPMPPGFAETSYGEIFSDCQTLNLGVFAIRVFAAGALLGNPPSAHTKITPYFPLALYERDCAMAARVAKQLGKRDLKDLAVRYVLSHPAVTSAIIGCGSAEEVSEVAAIAEHGRLEPTSISQIDGLIDRELVASIA
jgi:aryl-alcohol dehydrogenase-like predicted oxidoreductase